MADDLDPSLATNGSIEPGQSPAAAERFQRFARAVELPLAFLALLIVPALVLENSAQTRELREAAKYINWIVWLAFCGEYATKMYLAPARGSFAKRHWFDLLIIVLSPPFLVPLAFQGTRAVRAVRLLRLLRFVRGASVAAMGLLMAREALRHRRFHYVLLATVVVVTLGALCIYAVEHGTNRSIARSTMPSGGPSSRPRPWATAMSLRSLAKAEWSRSS
jgi:hypothetical protein